MLAARSASLIRDSRSLAALGWDAGLLFRLIEDMDHFVDSVQSLGLEQVHAAGLDLYAYLSGMEGCARPSEAHRDRLEGLAEQ